MRKLNKKFGNTLDEILIIFLIFLKLKLNNKNNYNNFYYPKNFIIFFPYLKFKNFFTIQFFKTIIFLTNFQYKYYHRYYIFKF